MVNLNFRDASYVFRISILYPFIFFGVILTIGNYIDYLSFSDILSVIDVFLIFFGILFGLPILLFLKYLVYSLGVKVEFKNGSLNYYKWKKLISEQKNDEEWSYTVFGEIHSFYMFPWLSFKFGVLKLGDDREIIITNLQVRKPEDLQIRNKEFKRNLLPSITINKIVRAIRTIE